MKKIIMILAMLGCLGSWAVAGEQVTKEDCVTKVKEAVSLVTKMGIDDAIAKMQDADGPFGWKGNYLFCVDINTGVMKSHPNAKLVGKKLLGIKDVTGKMFVMEYINLAKEKGEGWTSYMWPKPGTKKPAKKLNYVSRVPGEDILVGAGIFE